MEDKKFLSYFDELIAAEKQMSQRSAIFKIIKVLQESSSTSQGVQKNLNFGINCNPNVAYTLSRFIKGMASQTASVQQGFYLGFTMILHQFSQSIDLKLLLKYVHKTMMRQPHALKPAENCQRVIGEIMLLRGISTAFFKASKDKSHQNYQKAIQSIDQFIFLVARLYEENVKMVLGKRGGQSKYLHNLWFSLSTHILLIFVHSSSMFVKVVNVLLDKLLDSERSDESLNIDWIACRIALQIRIKHFALQLGVSLVQIPLLPESFLSQIKATSKSQDFQGFLKLSNQSNGIHPIFNFISSQLIYALLKSPKSAQESRDFFTQIYLLFQKQPIIILICVNSALEKIKDSIIGKHEFPFLQALQCLLSHELGTLLGKIFSNKFSKSKAADLKEKASQCIQLLTPIFNELAKNSEKITSFENGRRIFLNLFSSSQQLVLSSENKLILHSLTEILKKDRKDKQKKKNSLQMIMNKIQSSLEASLEIFKKQQEKDDQSLNKIYQKLTYQINLLTEICQISNQVQTLQSMVLQFLKKLESMSEQLSQKL